MVKSKDIFGAESDWSDPLVVTMPKSKVQSFPIIHWFFEKLMNRFPFLEPILG